MSMSFRGALATIASGLTLIAGGHAAAQQPADVVPSNITVQVESVGTMPFVLGEGFVVPPFAPLQPNLASPVPVKNKLLLIDQNEGIFRANGRNAASIQQIFSVADAPDGLALDNRQSILNVSPGSRKDTLFVMFEAGAEPGGHRDQAIREQSRCYRGPHRDSKLQRGWSETRIPGEASQPRARPGHRLFRRRRERPAPPAGAVSHGVRMPAATR